MIRSSFHAALAAVSLLCTPFPAMAQSAPDGVSTPVTLGESFTISSKVLGEPRRINVYLPPSYGEGGKSYPVLYLLDGGVGQDFPHIAGLSQLAWVSGAHQELVVIGIETVDRRKELTAPAASDSRYAETWPTHGRAADFRRYLAQEVIPFANGRFRLNGESALIGESLAGLFVVETFLRQPDLVDRYVAVSPSLWWDGQALSREAPALLARHARADRTLWLASADEGGAQQAATDRLVVALRAVPPPGLRWTYAARPEETHASIYHRAALDALRSLYGLDTSSEGAASPWWLR